MYKKLTLYLSLMLSIGIGVYFFILNPSVAVYQDGQAIEDTDVLHSNYGFKDGEENSENKLIIFSDYSCASCADLHKMISGNGIKKEFINSGKYEFIYKDAPSNKKNSFNASIAALAAREQGAYYKMQDLLFTEKDWGQREDKKIFYQYADKLDLDIGKFKKDMNNKELINEVQELEKEFNSLNFIGTPVLIINGKVIYGAPNNIKHLLKLLNGEPEL